MAYTDGKGSVAPRGATAVAATLVAVTVLMLIVPLPTWLIDGLIGLNLGLSIVLLAAALLQRSALELSSLPTVLVLLTIFRLALNVSSVRLILLQADAGRIIHAFGTFVVRGDSLAGLALFGLLALVQLLVIARGGERVAEVAARFALDALPTRLAAVDAELRIGVIDAEEGRRRRAALMREAQLYGSLDGAMRFVRGDAIAGLAVLAVSLVGGLAIGVLRRGLPVGDAARLYTLLTVGDGLVTQIPSLVVATAASLVVTRAGAGNDDEAIGDALVQQLGRPRALAAAAGVLFLLALVPGLPLVPFALAAALFALGAWSTSRAPMRRLDVRFPPQPPEIEIAVDAALAEHRDALTAESDRAGERVAADLGVPIAAPAVQLDARLALRTYEIRVRGTVMAQGTVPAGRVFVDCPPARLPEGIDGDATDDPLTGSLASFVPAEAAPALQRAGLVPRSAEEVIALRLEGVLRGAAPELLGLEETQRLLDRLRQSDGALVREVVPARITLPVLTQVLRRLVGEAVSIGDLRAILEELAPEEAPGASAQDLTLLIERVRYSLRRQLTARYARDRRVEALILDGDAEEAVRGAVRPTASGAVLQLEPDLADALLDSVRSELGSQPRAVLLAPRELRRHVRRLVEGEFPRLPVLAFDELQPEVLVERVGTLRVS